MAKYKIKITVDDSTGNITHVKFQGPKQATYDPLPHGSTWAGSVPAGYQLDSVFGSYCQPIEIYSKNPSCVRVGGWLFCP